MQQHGSKTTIRVQSHRSMFPCQRHSIISCLPLSRPIVALVAGVNEVHGHIMGHAGAFTIPGEPDAQTKIRALQGAGVTMVDHPAKFGEAIQRRLEAQSSLQATSTIQSPFAGTQRRNFHTLLRRPSQPHPRPSPITIQKRTIYLPESTSFDLLREQGVTASPYSGSGTRRLLAIGVDRSARSPCIIASPTLDPSTAKRFPFASPVQDSLAIDRIASYLQLTRSDSTVSSLRSVIRALATVFQDREAFFLSTHVVERLGAVEVVGADFGLDDAAYRSLGRQADLHRAAAAAAANLTPDTEAEAEAARHGIVYIRLPGGDATIGTLVNGAGLAMNTVDALALAGGRAANFLDTGGKATSETVKKSFEIILRDPRVKVVFVNIFGGLTLGDMIARGVVLAFKELEVKVPVVVRIRGTNEEEGQALIRESGLPLFAFDGFEEAVAKAVELSRV